MSRHSVSTPLSDFFPLIIAHRTTIGIHCVDGVVLAAEKQLFSRLLVKDTHNTVFPADKYSLIASSGIHPDGRALMNKTRDEAREYLTFYGSHIPGRVLADRLAGRIHTTTIYWSERPFGASPVIATYDDEAGCGLYMIPPTGAVCKYKAAVVGRHRQGAKTELEKIDFTKITCKEAVALIAMVLYKLFDDIKDKPFEIEAMWLHKDNDYKAANVPKELLTEAIETAKAAKQRALMADSDSDEE